MTNNRTIMIACGFLCMGTAFANAADSTRVGVRTSYTGTYISAEQGGGSSAFARPSVAVATAYNDSKIRTTGSNTRVAVKAITDATSNASNKKSVAVGQSVLMTRVVSGGERYASTVVTRSTAVNTPSGTTTRSEAAVKSKSF
jgi:hypothetical protein